jgi:hypothetical protein
LSGAIAKPASVNLRKLVLSPTVLINLDFILREDLLLCSSYLPPRVPNWAVNIAPSATYICALIEIDEEARNKDIMRGFSCSFWGENIGGNDKKDNGADISATLYWSAFSHCDYEI